MHGVQTNCERLHTALYFSLFQLQAPLQKKTSITGYGQNIEVVPSQTSKTGLSLEQNTSPLNPQVPETSTGSARIKNISE